MTTDVDQNTTVKAAFERASALLRAGDLRLAESACHDGLRMFPADGNLLCLLGGVLVRQKRGAEAEQALRSVIDRFPDFAKAHEELGNAMLLQRRFEDAEACLQRAMDLEPGNDQTSFKLDKVRAKLGRDGARAPHGDVFQEMLARKPDEPDVYRLMGNDAIRHGQVGDAIVLLRKSVDLDSGFGAGWLDLGKAYAVRGDFVEALDAARRAAELEPQAVLPHLHAAGYLSHLGRYAAAVEEYNAGLRANPGDRDCLVGLGHTLRTIGRHDGAVTAYREAMRMVPTDSEAYWSLANLKTERFEPDEIAAMHQYASQDNLDDGQRARFMFALGKAYEDQQDYAQSFQSYRDGNAAQRQLESYDPVETEAAFNRIIEVFSADLFDGRSAIGDKDPVPVFIVGMPRSGSTLVEQILASHSAIAGTRELPELDRLIDRLNQSASADQSYPEAIVQLDAEALAALGRQYLRVTERYRSGSPLFTDKMPANFRHVGLIHLILPNAKIINVHRHPLDSCMGSFKQLFISGHPYSYDLFELGEYYLEYRRLMAHWNEVLPGRVLDVGYEELVADPERQIRRMLEYCDLAWEDACLEFHKTDRAIVSASSEQVRQPIYATSVNDWRHYEQYLGELIDILRPLLSELPRDQRPQAND